MVNTGKRGDGVIDLIHLPLGLLALNYRATCVCSYIQMCMLSMDMEKHHTGESLNTGFVNFYYYFFKFSLSFG